MYRDSAIDSAVCAQDIMHIITAIFIRDYKIVCFYGGGALSSSKEKGVIYALSKKIGSCNITHGAARHFC